MTQQDGAAGDVTGEAARQAEGDDDARKLPSDPAAIEELIAQRRANLASTIDELALRARPREIARRSAADVRGRLTSFATTETGELRTERLAAVAGAFAAMVTLLMVLRRRRSRSR